jgi:DNA-binding MarR family transcriptional regulator
MDRTTLTANLKPLERRGLLKVTPDAEDWRFRRLTLVASGLALLHHAVLIWTAAHADIEKNVPGDSEQLRLQLNALARR